jgi:cytochrome c-type biogenesis protein CcmH/NrfG
MGLAIAILLAAILLVGLWRFGRLPLPTLQLVAAGLLLGIAGYAWQGRPGLRGVTPPAPARQEDRDSEFGRTREAMLGSFDRASAWLTIADSYLRRGDTRNAAGVIRSGLRAHPNDPDLWVGLGNALVMHSEGMMTPAAQFAFDRAAQLAPAHPGPRFFYGLALIQGGRLAEAETIWRELLANAPADVSWRPMVEDRLRVLTEIRAIAEGRKPMPEGLARELQRRQARPD